jgi:hypothetical protein
MHLSEDPWVPGYFAVGYSNLRVGVALRLNKTDIAIDYFASRLMPTIG